MNMDIYCDVCIIILCVQTICITPVLLYAIKYVTAVLCKSVDLVYFGSNARDRPGIVVQAKYINS